MNSFLRGIFSLLPGIALSGIVMVANSACQIPGKFDITPAASSAGIESAPSLTFNLNIGLESPGWEQHSKEIASFVAPKVKVIKNRYFSIKTSKKVIAMTFDDGPVLSNTTRLLDILKERKIKATFYVVGEMVRDNPQLLRRMIAEGHEIGNHTVKHSTLTRMSIESLEKELMTAHQAILSATGVEPKSMRPPGGAITEKQRIWMLANLGYPTILWSVDPNDWKRPGVDVVTRRLVEGAHPGAILLAHDLHAPTVDAMPSTLDQLLKKGYKFVTVSELIAMDESE